MTIKVQGQESSVGNQEKTIYVMGHAHMDPVYRWRWNEIINRELNKTFTDVLDVLDEYPDLALELITETLLLIAEGAYEFIIMSWELTATSTPEK